MNVRQASSFDRNLAAYEGTSGRSARILAADEAARTLGVTPAELRELPIPIVNFGRKRRWKRFDRWMLEDVMQYEDALAATGGDRDAAARFLHGVRSAASAIGIDERDAIDLLLRVAER